ncbi:uncharacterized protein LOC134203749 [Armigeres subalbatus]|uniref:uncharacterized protein LOC134203749 n=1 Tax=Armigeres subalbatus TaxID=124917 RepID=UPI002ED346E2
MSSRSKEIPGLDSQRSSHCPVVREGPALGCNFCWNTRRILRRKTKYHCPECHTNLCIAPCFQEYHERQSAENPAPTSNDSGSACVYGVGGLYAKVDLRLSTFTFAELCHSLCFFLWTFIEEILTESIKPCKRANLNRSTNSMMKITETAPLPKLQSINSAAMGSV